MRENCKLQERPHLCGWVQERFSSCAWQKFPRLSAGQSLSLRCSGTAAAGEIPHRTRRKLRQTRSVLEGYQMEFHVSREARDRYEFNQTLFSFSGNVVFANLSASREFAFRMNERRGAEKDPARTIQPGALYAMGLIDEMSHALVEYYRQRLDPKVMAGALEWFDSRLRQSGTG